MHVVLTGGTGLIGKHLARSLRADGHRVTVLTRHPHPSLPEGVASVRWQPTAARANHGAGGAAGGRGGTGRLDTWTEVLGDADAVVHLAGAPIAAGRWTAVRKRQIRESRVQSTRAVVQALARSQRRPGVLVSASAVGYYGPRGDEVVTEEDGPGRDFLSEVARAWEEEALRAEALGVRVVLLRTGLVLD
ncbi:MAG: NAD-dependent epimerase/dehydratase family protein, partial [Clostridia bacterium]|nr:NAD-dependent epimerase/dehydratase family protein [Clostridia bacterium]